MATVLTAEPIPLRGSVRLSAEGVPDGQVLITRSERRTPEVVRGGEFTLTTGGFVVEDPEPPFGYPLTYRVTVEVPDRHLQTNRVLNPKAATNTANWTAGTGRSITRETAADLRPPRDATTSLRIDPTSIGAVDTPTIANRTVAYTTPSDFGAGRWYLTGQVRYDTPDLWVWQDVRNNGTWAALRTQGDWQQVRSSSDEAEGAAFATLWAAVLSQSGALVVPPFQILGVQATGGQEWHTFSAWLDVPATAPAGSRLVFLQGATMQEFSVSWWLTTLMVTPEAEMAAGALGYFDGDTVVPVNPAASMIPDGRWIPVTNNASIEWNGTPNNSVSVFIGPSAIATEVVVQIPKPDTTALRKIRQPVYLSDPVAPQLGVWFELLAIGALSRAARASLYDILSRAPQIAVSQRRAWPTGELRLLTRTPEEESVADRLFDSGRILFYRNLDPRYPESSWYLHIGDVSYSRVGDNVGPTPERIWSVPFVRVERPVGMIETASGITWADVRSGYPTWEDLRKQRRDWLDSALTRPSA